jgi:hypothetical protein
MSHILYTFTIIRVAFGHQATPEKFRYSEDLNSSQVDIRSDFPQRISKLPIIIVTVGSGDAGVTYVGDEFLRETTVASDGVEGYLYGGKLMLDVNMDIYCQTMRDAEHLSDIVSLYVRYLFRNKFAQYNMPYTKIDSVGISEKDNMMVNTVKTRVTCEFQHFIEKSLYDMVQSLTFEIGTYF